MHSPGIDYSLQARASLVDGAWEPVSLVPVETSHERILSYLDDTRAGDKLTTIPDVMEIQAGVTSLGLFKVAFVPKFLCLWRRK